MDTIQAEHNFQELQVKQRSKLKMAEIEKQIEQLKVREEAEITLAQVQQVQERLRMNRESHEAILKAEEEAQVKEYSAKAQLKRAENEARKKEKEELNTAKSQLLNTQLQAEATLKSGIAKSYNEVVVAKEKAETIRLQASVHAAVGPQVMLQRSHELSLQSKKILARLAEHGDYNLVGKEGDALIKSLLGGSLEEGLS